jgi:threonine dehydrogenase-like Zn-dependent dehydrogenase
VPPPGTDLRPGEAVVHVLAGGICGSDAPSFRTGLAFDGRSPLLPGSPLHEVVGEVVLAASDELKPGDRVVGWATRFDGLSDYIITEASSLHAYQIELPPEEAVVMQPLACVLYAVERIGSVAGQTCTVLGLGPIGLLFCHVLKQRGAVRVTGVDRVDRSAVAPLFGVDEVIWGSSHQYAAQVGEGSRPDVIVEAVGHQVSTLQDAVSAIGENGRIFYFGVPDDEIYPINMMRLMRSNLTLTSGTTLERARVLAEAEEYVRKFPEIVGALITHRFSRADVQRAFEVAVTSSAARLKVVIRFDETAPR